MLLALEQFLLGEDHAIWCQPSRLHAVERDARMTGAASSSGTHCPCSRCRKQPCSDIRRARPLGLRPAGIFKRSKRWGRRKVLTIALHEATTKYL